MYPKLQYISQGADERQQLDNIKKALDGGCGWIQLRYKERSEKEVTDLAAQIKTFCTKYKATFIVNDHVKVAVSVDADGVHLGLDDVAVNEARKILGSQKIIGGTANTLQHVLQRIEEKCNYVGLGPFRFTTTKKKLSPVLGTEGYKKIMDELRSQPEHIPVYAIGGIEMNDVEPLLKCGVHGLAVSGVITNAANGNELISNLNMKLHGFIKDSR